MVARRDMAGDARRRAALARAGALFLVWRRWRLRWSSHAARGRSRPRRAGACDGVPRPSRHSAAPCAHPRAAAAPDERRALAVAGLALARRRGPCSRWRSRGPLGIPGPPSGHRDRVDARLGAAAARASSASRSPRRAAAGVGTAWAGGLLPELIAFTDPLAARRARRFGVADPRHAAGSRRVRVAKRGAPSRGLTARRPARRRRARGSPRRAAALPARPG